MNIENLKEEMQIYLTRCIRLKRQQIRYKTETKLSSNTIRLSAFRKKKVEKKTDLLTNEYLPKIISKKDRRAQRMRLRKKLREKLKTKLKRLRRLLKRPNDTVQFDPDFLCLGPSIRRQSFLKKMSSDKLKNYLVRLKRHYRYSLFNVKVKINKYATPRGKILLNYKKAIYR
ncbi:hypothetical protein ACTA71_008782, partial [Dictyostelium dimigraforme]